MNSRRRELTPGRLAGDGRLDTGPADGLAQVTPRYGEASLADVIPSMLAALGVPGARDVLGLSDSALAGTRRMVLLLVDGLGHLLLPIAAPVAPTLADLASGRLGAAMQLTAGFPSTTPTSLVSIATGAPPGPHGVLGFTVNVPGTRRVLIHTMWRDDPDPLRWQPLETQFAVAARHGVAVTVVSRPEFVGSGLTGAMFRGAAYRGATAPDEIVSGVLHSLATEPRSLVYGYTPEVDRAGHLYGVGSAEWLAAVSEVDRLLTRLLDGLPPDAALLVTADHGMLDVPAGDRVDVDTHRSLRKGIQVLAGEPRVRYLHIRQGARSDVIATWRELLGDRVWVVTREEAVAAGWFGPVPEAHLARIGDVVAVCRGRTTLIATRREPPMTSR
ncbi:MAG TPA: nucleotide pyrophosphatase/phosphodiesterase family protein, partial [Micromonosporaceae bacterium]|nr:nucleotide pyrophosphatase/phosphodiesterase family protein [Micromonosporaceae bacterium]